MKRIWTLLLACTLALSLAACTQGADPGGSGSGGGAGGGSGNGGNGGGAVSGPASPGETPPAEGYDAEYTIYVNGSDEWTPFAGKSGVSFALSDDKVISVSDNGTKISFTGKQVGKSIITATLDGAEATALVRVREMEKETDKAAIPLIRDLPESYYIEYEAGGQENSFSICLTKDSYSKKYFDNDDALYGWNTDYYTPSVNYAYWEGYGWMDTTDDNAWNSAKFTKWRTEGNEPFFYEALCSFRMVIAEKGASVVNDISRYDTGKSETIADVECEIYEIGSYTYWVEPTYHFCLKYISDDNDEFAITKYEVPYEGENSLGPQSGDVIHHSGE